MYRLISQHKSKTHGREKQPRGFSLIELLVSVALFAVVMVVSVGTLLALVDANKKAQTLKTVINNLNFGLDSMTRSMRTGYGFHCATNSMTSLPTTPASCTTGGSAVSFTNDKGDRIGFRYNSSNESIERCVENCGSSSNWARLTSPDVRIEEARFYVSGALSGDETQPLITISVRGQAGLQTATASDFDIQTTVTQRVLDQ